MTTKVHHTLWQCVVHRAYNAMYLFPACCAYRSPSPVDQDVNEQVAVSLGDQHTPLGKVVRVLNNQLQALMQIDARTRELNSAADSVANSMRKANGSNGTARVA